MNNDFVCQVIRAIRVIKAIRVIRTIRANYQHYFVFPGAGATR